MRNDLMEQFPPMLIGDDLYNSVRYLPPYTTEIQMADAGRRLSELSMLSDLYLPSKMTAEIYSKIYMAMRRSLRKKGTPEMIQQGVQNHRFISGMQSSAILGGRDSFSIIGKAGIGKSTAIEKSIQAIGLDTIRSENPLTTIIPCIHIQCPHDCSVKCLLIDILSVVDSIIGTHYRERAIKYRSTTDLLIGVVSQVCLNHVLLLIVDECQNMCRTKTGTKIISALTQLINSSGISICLVGLPETEEFFQREMHLARRTVGLRYGEMPFREKFIEFCDAMYRYQYVAKPSPLTPAILEMLYQCSGGIIGIVMSLFIEAQEKAIMSGREELTPQVFQETFRTRFANIKAFVEPDKPRLSQTTVKGRTKKTPLFCQQARRIETPDENVSVGGSVEDADDRGDALLTAGLVAKEVPV